MTSVWVTRTLPGAETTAERVQGAGMNPFIAPLLEVVFEPDAEIDLTGVGSLAFTSANGVRAFATRSEVRGLPVFTVGRGTAKTAREAGFSSVTASDGDVLALARAIPPGGGVLHPGAAEPAADLVLALRRRGITARGVVVYSTVTAVLSEADRVEASAADFVLVQSAKAARAFRDLVIDTPVPVCLSPAIATALLPREAVFATAPTEDALIAALIAAAAR